MVAAERVLSIVNDNTRVEESDTKCPNYTRQTPGWEKIVNVDYYLLLLKALQVCGAP